MNITSRMSCYGWVDVTVTEGGTTIEDSMHGAWLVSLRKDLIAVLDDVEDQLVKDEQIEEGDRLT